MEQSVPKILERCFGESLVFPTHKAILPVLESLVAALAFLAQKLDDLVLFSLGIVALYHLVAVKNALDLFGNVLVLVASAVETSAHSFVFVLEKTFRFQNPLAGNKIKILHCH